MVRGVLGNFPDQLWANIYWHEKSVLGGRQKGHSGNGQLGGFYIGPEPTTDRFVVVMCGPDERSMSGNTVVFRSDLPFSGLTTFGGAFLSKFECSQCHMSC
ncbi:hypothetical protein POM88_025434 [Heracleum sosnowskyi]|uniref:Uncharacterized protein n=1 Tax=Heracleum sosnowskyi TaxID=360622 RepID=A0AAD8I702_9APIA|nr:hypothetical protein POM88_025429 [Heracleum sosnowskyi]KAK1378690.1 hypothetical protein POM88_025434 [Heracleum sosnowskyi]